MTEEAAPLTREAAPLTAGSAAFAVGAAASASAAVASVVAAVAAASFVFCGALTTLEAEAASEDAPVTPVEMRSTAASTDKKRMVARVPKGSLGYPPKTDFSGSSHNSSSFSK